MTCRQLIDFLCDYLEGDLAPAQQREFDQHLSSCSACRQYLDQYKSAIHLARSLAGQDDAQPQVPPELIKAIVDASRK